MTSRSVTELMAARRYISAVLLSMDVSAYEITLGRFIELLDYFSEHPSEYLELTNESCTSS